MGKKWGFKKGAASFYIVAISTLVLVIVAASFAAVIISELARTSNADLAQSAYDSALAGVEDAKLAYYNYMKCEQGQAASTDVSCSDIKNAINSQECDMVATILNRKNDAGEVLIEESTNGDNKMMQAYTCVKIIPELTDKEFSLSTEKTTEITKVKLADGDASNIKTMEVKWGLPTDGAIDAKNLPILSIGLIQTAETFTLEQFDMTIGEQTNRGTIFLIPYMGDGDGGPEGKDTDDSYILAYKDGKNTIDKDGFLKSNDKVPGDKPYAVRCNEDDGSNGGYVCSVTIDLPGPVGGGRSSENFMIVATAMGIVEDTDVSLSFCEGEGGCIEEKTGGERETSYVRLTNQVGVDSTGRANDLYRRVETRLESEGAGASALQLYNAVQAMGDGTGEGIQKIPYAVCEKNFDVSNCTKE